MLHGDQPTSRREQAKGGRRARIVEATYTLLRDVGVADLSVKMIADQAGVSPATIYNLFGTKAAVLEKVYERDKLEFETRVAATPSSDSLDKIFNCLVISASLYRADPRFYRSVVLTTPALTDAELVDKVFETRATFWSDMRRRRGAGRASARSTPIPLQAWARR